MPACEQHTSFKLSFPYVLMLSSHAAAAPGTVTVRALKGSNSPPVTPSSLAFCTIAETSEFSAQTRNLYVRSSPRVFNVTRPLPSFMYLPTPPTPASALQNTLCALSCNPPTPSLHKWPLFTPKLCCQQHMSQSATCKRLLHTAILVPAIQFVLTCSE